MQDEQQITPSPQPPVGTPTDPVVEPSPELEKTLPETPQNSADSSPPSDDEAAEPEAQKPKKEGGILSFVFTLLAAFILVQVINMFFFQSYKVFGSSMYSTLHDGDRLIISKVGRTEAKIRGKNYLPKRGDIIVFIDPQNPDLQLIKRVIGLPGERVVVRDQRLTVYNKEHPEGFNPDDAPYGKDLPPTSGENDVTVPANQLFVSGDNRAGSNSLDSRNELGTVPEKNIIGTLKVRIFPFDSAKFF